jgi:NADH:ubiquinone oxidoreductase subunit 3 (subunit A)
MNIMRGTFRVAIVVTVLTSVASAYQQWVRISDEKFRQSQLLFGYECGARQLEQIEADYTGPAMGNIDLSKYGCAATAFWASLEELRSVRAGRSLFEDPPRPFPWDVVFNNALAIFIVVNLLGLLFLAGRSTLRWIAKGFRSESP